MTVGDEDLILAEDQWRTAGDVPKVASHLGAHMRAQLTARGQERNAEYLKSFCKLDEPESVSGEAIRPLLRSLIIRELDRIKNGN